MLEEHNNNELMKINLDEEESEKEQAGARKGEKVEMKVEKGSGEVKMVQQGSEEEEQSRQLGKLEQMGQSGQSGNVMAMQINRIVENTKAGMQGPLPEDIFAEDEEEEERGGFDRGGEKEPREYLTYEEEPEGEREKPEEEGEMEQESPGNVP